MFGIGRIGAFFDTLSKRGIRLSKKELNCNRVGLPDIWVTVYTSRTTGSSKGVKAWWKHQAFCNICRRNHQ